MIKEMPHEKKRYLSQAIQKGITHSSIIGVLGQRQTGKTTLVQHHTKNHYVTLDDPEQLSQARSQPKQFLKTDFKTYGIDECQLAPELFPALKLQVQNHPAKGQFIITGSVRFNARKEIRESLTGRIQLLELHPMTYSEAHEYPLPDLFKMVFQSKEAFTQSIRKRLTLISKDSAKNYLEVGGLPGICFFRDRSIRTSKMNSHLDTLLGRDIKLVSETTLTVQSLRNLLALIAQEQGVPLTLSALVRKSRISKNALIKVLVALEALFLIKAVQPLGETKKNAYYLADQGMASHLAMSSSGFNDLLRLCYSQLFPHFDYCYPGNIESYHYETRNGASVPLVFRNGKQMIGVIPSFSEVPERRTFDSAGSFLKKFPQAKVLILTQGSEVFAQGESIFVLPIRGIF